MTGDNIIPVGDGHFFTGENGLEMSIFFNFFLLLAVKVLNSFFEFTIIVKPILFRDF